MNPFLVPGCEDPITPLDPDVRGTVDDYVDVDRTEEAFRQFTAAIGDGRRIVQEGRFVVVSGFSGCGKTALINRCVRWLADAGSGLFPHVVDVRRDLRANPDVEERKKRVCERLVDELGSVPMIREDSRILDMPAEPERIYPLLGRELQDNSFVMLLLPPSAEVIDELIEYARLTRPKMLVFAETAFPRRLAERREEIRPAPLFLAVGPLRAPDGDSFAEARLQRSRLAGTWPIGAAPPPVRAGVLGPIIGVRPYSILELQRMLHYVYEEILRSGTQPAQVTKDHFLRYYIRRAATEGNS